MKLIDLLFLASSAAALGPNYSLKNWDEPFNATEYDRLIGKHIRNAKRDGSCSADENGKTCLHLGNEQIETILFSAVADNYPKAFTEMWDAFHERCNISPCDTTKKCFEENHTNYCVVWTGTFIGDITPLYEMMRRNFDKTVEKKIDDIPQMPPCGNPTCGPPTHAFTIHHTGPTFVGSNHRDNNGGDNVLTMAITAEPSDGNCPGWLEAIGDAGAVVKEYGEYFSAGIGAFCSLIG
ncbi:hypothetical protein VHEMI08012 [[Torrubiella] hemipterigena]|uniref:Uncharacterized protein n=1 Tax=[Torrubiella] hemipterigena TaxID=1531966 RepID=A0A0A1T5B5_9HYPO|nr:hypothetical protein VHEMI08012 [[Torrubiella] hemipterigena]